MKRKNLSILMIALIAVAMLAMTLLCACNSENTSSDSDAEPTEEMGKGPKMELAVTFDENEEYTLSSIEDLSELVEVKVVSDGAERKVDFTVKSAVLSEDGQTIEVVIVAEGIESIIHLPYIDDVRALIRKDLRPLYDLCAGSGDRGIVLSLTGGGLWSEEVVPLSATLNFKEDDRVEFALTRGVSDAELVAGYQDGMVTLFGVTVDAKRLMEHLERVTGRSLISDGPETALASEEESAHDDILGKDDIAPLFIGLSSLLDTFDALAEVMPDMGLSVNDGVYRFSCGSAQLLSVLQSMIEDEEEKALINLIVEVLDAKTVGGFRGNKFFLDLYFEVTERGAELSFVAKNWDTRDEYSLSLSARVFDHAAILPEDMEAATPNDLEITIPFALPQKGLDLTIKTEVFLSDILGDVEDKKCLRTTVTDETGAVVALFVLNDGEAYLDLSGTSKFFGEEEPFADAVFYRAFESEVSPLISFLDSLSADWEDLPDEEQAPEAEPAPDVRFERGYGVTILEGSKLLFDLGETLTFEGAATEEDIRSRIFAYYLDEEGEKVEYTDYKVLDYDGREYFKGKVTIEFAAGYCVSIPVLTYYRTSGTMSFKSIPVGTTFEEVKDLYIGVLDCNNGRYFWTELLNGFSVKTVHSPELKSSAFDQVGNYSITFTHELTGKDYWFNVTVSDFSTPEVWKIACEDEIYLTSTTTEEEARAQLHVYLYYQDGTKVPVTNYSLISYSTGATTIQVYYYEPPAYSLSKIVSVRHVEDYTDYLRFFRRGEKKSILTQFLIALRDVYAPRKALFAEVFTIERTQDGLKWHLPINNEENRDLLEIVGKFIGLPGEYKQIDENTLLDYLEELKAEDPAMDVAALFEELVGVALSDFLASLYLDLEIDLDGSMDIALGDGGEQVYLATGYSFRAVGHSNGETLSEEMISAARDFEELPVFLFDVLSGALGLEA